MFVVYVICNSLGEFYIGQTDNLQIRLLRHNGILKNKNSSYTHKHQGPWEVLFSEELESRAKAIQREKQLKSYQGRQYIKQILTNKKI